MQSLKAMPLVLLLSYSIRTAPAQSVSISNANNPPDASAMLDVSSTSKGMLIPRVALTASNVAGPVTGPLTSLLVYNTATAGTNPNNVSPGYYYWNGTSWLRLLDGVFTPPSAGSSSSPTVGTYTQTYSAGGPYSWVVPGTVTKGQVKIWLTGGGGGDGNAGANGGTGSGIVIGLMDVTVGETITITVGSGGASGGASSPGNGGTGTTVYRGGTLIAQAGGGGGGRGNCCSDGSVAGGMSLGNGSPNGANGTAGAPGAGGPNWFAGLREPDAYGGRCIGDASGFYSNSFSPFGSTGYGDPGGGNGYVYITW